MNKTCPICQRPGAEISWGAAEELLGWEGSKDPLFRRVALASVECLACGKYEIDQKLAVKVARVLAADNRYILAAAIRSKNEARIDVRITNEDELHELCNYVKLPEGPLDSIDRIIHYVHEHTQSADAGPASIQTTMPRLRVREINPTSRIFYRRQSSN